MAAGGKRSSEQEAFAQELKDCVDSLVEAYVNVLNAGKFHSKDLGRSTSERERLEMSTNAALVVGQTQNLHRMISELKLSLLTSDLDGMNKIVSEQNKEYQANQNESERQLVKIENQVQSALDQLEAHYYSSVYR